MSVIRCAKNHDEYVKELRIMNINAISPFENNSLAHHNKTSLCEQTVSDESAALALKNIFFFLGLVFRYPDKAVYAEIQKNLKAFEDFFLEYCDGSPSLPDISDLQAEYVSLFVNNMGFVPALPYASFYHDQGQLMGRAYFRIKHILEESGFRLDASAAELEDNLSVMLESCAGLVDVFIKNECNTQKIRKTIRVLLEIASNINNWVDDFAEKIRSYASLDFYKVSSAALKNFIHNIDDIFEQALGLNQNSE
jgi:TorA maturation chaperone TorD